MDELEPAVVDDIDGIHASCVNAAAANFNFPHITVMEPKITGVNNSVDEVPAVTKESK